MTYYVLSGTLNMTLWLPICYLCSCQVCVLKYFT